MQQHAEHRASGTRSPDRVPEPGVDTDFDLAVLGVPLLAFIANGLPAPQGSKSTGVSTKTGRTFTRESSKNVKPWRQDVVSAVVDAKPADWAPINGPVVLDLVFTVHRPLSAPKTRRVYPDKSPDLDKLVRSTLDGLKTGGVYTDDGKVVGFRRLREFYAGDPDRDALPGGEIGALIRVWQLPILQFATIPARPTPALPIDTPRARPRGRASVAPILVGAL